MLLQLYWLLLRNCLKPDHDKLQRAKAVDPSVAEEANKLIGTYSGHTPQAKDLFMLGYKQGDRITIGGWIGETTTIR